MSPVPSELWQIISEIPVGSVSTYGDIGRALPHPATGRMVGRWMAQCPEGVPWWRVVASTGQLPIGKRDPYLQLEQQELLRIEGIPEGEGGIDMTRYRYIP